MTDRVPQTSARPHAGNRGTARPGFTLIELLVVITIIVLILGMAVPAFKYITGTRSVAAGQNRVSAMIQRARGIAIGLQRPTGVWFYMDPVSDRAAMGIVFVTPTPVNSTETIVYLDRDPDQGFELLPPGVTAQLLNNPITPSGQQTDKYIGYNKRPTDSAPYGLQYGGVILFDGGGRLITPSYGFRLIDPVTKQPTSMGTFFSSYSSSSGSPPTANFIPSGSERTAPQTQFGLVLLDQDAYAAKGFTRTDPSLSGGSFNATEQTKEAWIDNNGVPLIVGRYTGTLTRGG